MLVGDRGFGSFAHLALLAQRGLYGVFRMHRMQIVDFTPGRSHVRPGRKYVAEGLPRSRWVRALGQTARAVEWYKPPEAPARMTAAEYRALPGSLPVRELRYRTEVPGFRTRVATLATTLLDGEVYPATDLAELYFRRWSVETHLRDLKQTMGMDVLRCQPVAGVTKELTVYCLAYNLVRATIPEAASRQGVAVERVSFLDALRWLACARAGERLPELVINPHRPGRFEPRSTKRRPKTCPWLTVPRHELRKRLSKQADTA